MCFSSLIQIQIVPNVKMEEVNRNLKHLVLIYLHHHKQISKSKQTYLDTFLATSNRPLHPTVLILKKLRVEVSDASR